MMNVIDLPTHTRTLTRACVPDDSSRSIPPIYPQVEEEKIQTLTKELGEIERAVHAVRGRLS